jgi:hypothetical protein
MIEMRFTTQIQTIKSTKSPIHKPEGELVSNHNFNHIQNNKNNNDDDDIL